MVHFLERFSEVDLGKFDLGFCYYFDTQIKHKFSIINLLHYLT
eukprot:UN11499